MSRKIKKGDVVVNREGDYAHYYIAMEDIGALLASSIPLPSRAVHITLSTAKPLLLLTKLGSCC